MTTIYTFLLFMIISISTLYAQTVNIISDTVAKDDNVVIRLNDYTGDIQWQKSYDNTNWIDITNANADTLLFIADETSFFRASVTVGTCEPFISDVAEIIVNIPVDLAISQVYDQGRFVYGSHDLCMHKLCNSDLIKKGTHLLDQTVFNQYASLQSFDATNTAVRDIWNGYY